MNAELHSKSYVIANYKNTTRKTFCVLGAPRGGTSMVAGLLRLMGIHMGEHVDPANNEDKEFTCHQGDRSIFQFKGEEFEIYLNSISKYINLKNKKHSIWGWKDPLSAYYVEEISPLLFEPFYIFVLRDPLAVALGEKNKNGSSILDSLSGCCSIYQKSIRFAIESQSPVLFISYEKAIQHKEDIVNGLELFSGVKIETKDKPLLESYITSGADSAELDRWLGRRKAQRNLSLFSDHITNMLYDYEIRRDVLEEEVNKAINTPKKDHRDLFEQEREIVSSIEEKTEKEDYRDALSRIVLAEIFYREKFNVSTTHSESVIVDGIDHSSPRKLANLLFCRGIVHVNHTRFYDKAITDFRKAYFLCRQYIHKSTPGWEEPAIHYLWASKFHEGYVLDITGRKNEAAEIRYFIEMAYKEKSEMFSHYISESIYNRTISELPEIY